MTDLDFYLVFCADGILRVRYYDSSIAVPVTFMQEQEGIKDDAHFWFNWWNKNVILEEGLTLGRLVECLMPWEVFWSNYIGIELNEYFKEGRRLALAKDEPPYDWLMYRKHIVISHSCTFNQPDNVVELHLNHSKVEPSSPTIHPFWTTSESYKLSGYKKGLDEDFNPSATPFNQLYNIPIFINKMAVIEFHDYWYKQSDKRSIFNNEGFGVRKLGELCYVLGHTEYTLREFLATVFNEFELNPLIRDQVEKDHDAMISELMAEMDEAIKEEGMPEEPVFLPSQAGLDALKLQVEQEVNYWKQIVEAAKKSCTQPLKIGTITEGVEPVQYVYDKTIDLDEEI